MSVEFPFAVVLWWNPSSLGVRESMRRSDFSGDVVLPLKETSTQIWEIQFPT